MTVLSTAPKERAGNRLPHPATLFVLMGALTLAASSIARHFGVTAIHPKDGSTIAAINLLDREGVRRIFTEAVRNFMGFAPLGTVLVAMLGIGVASFSHVQGTHFQNEHDLSPYLEKVGQGMLPILRALTPNQDERMIRELVLQMKLGRLQKAYFRDKFGVEIEHKFAAPFQELRDQGFLTSDQSSLRLNRDGLLQVDKLLHEFFLPEHRNARYA